MNAANDSATGAENFASDAPARSTSAVAVSDTARPYRGRRLSWVEFYKLTNRQPANDNDDVAEAA